MRAVELFAGAGGMSLGLMRAGFEVVQAYDSWKPAVDVYRRNVGPHIWQHDLKDIFHIGPMIAALAPDIIVGGPPCQDFSAAGERIEGERAALTRAFAMLVCIARPRWFLMENVPRAATSQAWADARAMLVRTGYGLTESKLDASFYDVPQSRMRLFVIGRLGEADGFLESALAAARSPRPMTVRDMLGDALGEAFYAHPRHAGKRGVWGVDEPAPTMRGSSRRPMPPSYQPHPADAALVEAGTFFTRPYHDGRGVRTLDEPAPAVVRTTRERPRQSHLDHPHPDDAAHPSAAAVLTQEQVSRIQGFPASWDWSPALIRDADQMIANAVPAPLAEAIGSVILTREAGESIPEIEGRFGQWLRVRRGFSKPAVRNCKSRVNRARRLLGGRTFPDAAAELVALDAAEGFGSLTTGTRSDLRTALRLYREWQAEPTKTRKPKAAASPMASRQPRIVSWFSCGAASAVATKLALANASGREVVIAYCDTSKREHPDNMRFLKDCERWFGQEILILGNDEYKRDPHVVFRKTRFLVGPSGARCTAELKRSVRLGFQRPDDTVVLGYTAEEYERRHRRTVAAEPTVKFWPILHERGITKGDCLAMIERAGIKLPAMYELGYRNNNCIGCVKGGAGYWNRIRIDFPERFAEMAAIERELGRTICKREWKDSGGVRHIERIPLDRLPPDLGRHESEPDISCGTICQSGLAEIEDCEDTASVAELVA